MVTLVSFRSGVAVLSCTDCSGSSTASSDITDPGSPFSTGSNHSEDSGTHSTKMPPTQSVNHPPWPWASDESPATIKRPPDEKAVFPKRLKTSDKKSPACFSQPSDGVGPKNKQGKITEYFKAQMKSNGIKKELSKTRVTLIEPNKQQLNVMLKSQALRKVDARTVSPAVRKVVADVKARKLSPVSVPRKILPAPSKIPEKIQVGPIPSFPQTVTLTALSFPPNLTYLHAKTPKPPDNIFVQQIPIVNRTCLIQPIQKLAPANTFNCFKLNGTVVPIVKLNTMPSRFNGSVQPVLKPKTMETTATSNVVPQKEASPADSDSGISGKDLLEVAVDQPVNVECQKSPILSQPKTIRFPAKQKEPEEKEPRAHSSDTINCRWDDCHTHFDTSGALLEHLQVGDEVLAVQSNRDDGCTLSEVDFCVNRISRDFSC